MQSTKKESYETLTAAGDWATSLCVCVYMLVAQLCPTLCNPTDCSPQGSSVHGDSPGKNTRVGCHAFLPPKVYILECSDYDGENGGFRDSGGGGWRVEHGGPALPPTSLPSLLLQSIRGIEHRAFPFIM